jgi:hypothetical protein
VKKIKSSYTLEERERQRKIERRRVERRGKVKGGVEK